MKYSLFIDIEKPRTEVFALFDDPENLKHWQPGLQDFKLIEGSEGEIGSKHLIRYNMNGRQVEMVETLEARETPTRLCGTYETDKVWNRVDNYFEEVDPNTTRWISEVEFRLSGLMKFMGWIMPGMFKKQSFKFMKNFKEFAENKE